MEPRTRAHGPDISLGRGQRAPELAVEPEADLGGLWLVARSDREEAQARAEQAGLMWISIPAPEASERGRLALVVEAAIEDELANRGAGAAGFGAATNLDATLSDQLYRARTLSARGFALSFDTLARVTNLAGALDAEDSAILRWWLTASRERPVRILFDARDRYLGVYTRPVALETLLGARGETFLTATSEALGALSVEPVPPAAGELRASEASEAAADAAEDGAEAAHTDAEQAFAALSNAEALRLAPWSDASDGYSLADLTRELRESSPPPPPSRRSVPPPPPTRADLESNGSASLSLEEAAAAGQLSLDLQSPVESDSAEPSTAQADVGLQSVAALTEEAPTEEAPTEEASAEVALAEQALAEQPVAEEGPLDKAEPVAEEGPLDKAEPLGAPVESAESSQLAEPEPEGSQQLAAQSEAAATQIAAPNDAELEEPLAATVEAPRTSDPATPASEARQFAFRSVLAALEALEHEDLGESPVAPAAEQDWGTPEPPEELSSASASDQPEEPVELHAAQADDSDLVQGSEIDAQSPLGDADAAPPSSAGTRPAELSAEAALAAVHEVVAAAPEALAEPDASPVSEGFAALLTRDDQTPLPTRNIRTDQLDGQPRLTPTRMAPRETFDDALDRSSQAPEVAPKPCAAVSAQPEPALESLADAPEPHLEETSDSHTVVEAQVEALDVSGPIATHGRATLEVLDSASSESSSLDAQPASDLDAPQASVSGADESDIRVPESTWRGWVRDLEAARGPKPLAVVERLFTSAYVPLLAARMSQELDAQALDALDSWSTAFAKSYSEAFDALRIRGKRPTMVLDVPDIALRHGRMHGARQAQLILVDGLRFDLGQMVHEHLKDLVGRDAACVERLLLWSALPATTATQLELLGRGPQGLREPISSERDVPVARGRAASTLRRVKAGHRDVMKLDLVESRITEPGATKPGAMRSLSAEVAEVLWGHMSGLPPRTLVLIFGDHGFAIDPNTGAATHSSRAPSAATPEEVLVPAFAWLTGSVH